MIDEPSPFADASERAAFIAAMQTLLVAEPDNGEARDAMMRVLLADDDAG